MRRYFKFSLLLFILVMVSPTIFAAPIISNVQVEKLYGTSATIVWTTDVESTSRVTYGTSTPPSTNIDDDNMVTSHRIIITGLTTCTTYYFSVTSNDGVGSTTDDNNGNYYTFKTGLDTKGSYSSTDVPKEVPASSSATSTLTINDSKIIGDINVNVELLSSEATGLIEIYLVTPDLAEIPLIIVSSGSSFIDPNFEDTIFDDEAEESIIMQSSPFTGTFKPTAHLSYLYGKNAYGQWGLKVINDSEKQASIDSWGLDITYQYEYCEPHIKLDSYTINDLCTGTGNGNNDEIVDPGEDITLPITLYNDGNGNLTSISGTLTTTTSGISITTSSSDFPNINKNGSGTSSTNFKFSVNVSKSCGDIINFNLHITSYENESGWNIPFLIVIGNKPPASDTVIEEYFDLGLPSNWTVVDGGDNTGAGEAATWFAGDQCKRSFYWKPPLSPPFAEVDSDCAGELASQDEELITHSMDLSFATCVTLTYDTIFAIYSGNEIGDVDIKSSKTNGEWINVKRYNGNVPEDPSTGYPQNETIDLSDYGAGAINVQLRFHYYNAVYDMFWVIDNLKLEYSGSTSCFMDRCCPSMTTPQLTITDNNLCSQTGIKIEFTSSTPATRHDFYVDGNLVTSDVTSPIEYDPNDSSEHSYKIKAINYYEDCYIESSESKFTDEAKTPPKPSPPTIEDLYPCETSTIAISWSSVQYATNYDLLVDGTTTINNVTSPYDYNPNGNDSHTYQIRGRNVINESVTCTGEWSNTTSFADGNEKPATPSSPPTVLDVNACLTNGVSITWSSLNKATAYDLRVDSSDSKIVENVTIPYTYQPGDNNSHTYQIRGKNGTCTGDWGPTASGTDINDTPGAPAITAIADIDSCATSGITITYTAGTGATSHDLYKDGTLAVTNYVSGATYQPGNNTSHSYVIRAKKNTCYTDSTAVAGTDVNDKPGAPTITGITDVDACATSGIKVAYTAGSGATSHDLYKDGTLAVTNYVSGAIYQPGDNSSHNYAIRAKKNTCYTDSTSFSGTDVNNTPGQPVITSITDNDACATSGITITYTAGTGATSHDLYKDGSLAVSGYSSGATYQPGDNSSHNYTIRAKKNSCYNDSTGISGTDQNLKPATPSAPSFSDIDACATSGVQISWGNVSQATGYDLRVDGSTIIPDVTSPYTYYPNDNTSHTYQVRGKNATCTGEWSNGTNGTDVNNSVATPSILSVTDKDACAVSGVTIAWGAITGATSYDIAINTTGNVVGNTASTSYDYSPGDTSAHNYYVRAKNASCTGDWSTGVSGTDVNNSVATPSISSVTDKDACALSGVTIAWGAISGATSYDIAFNTTSNIVGNTASTSYDYSPSDSGTYNYYVRAKNITCTGSWSSAFSGTDTNNTPGQPVITSIEDIDACSTNGIKIYYTPGSGAEVHDLYKDGILAQSSYTSGATYLPGDNSSHTYVIRAIKETCYKDSQGVDGTDVNDTVGTPLITSIADNDGCLQNGIKVYYNEGVGAVVHSLWKDSVEVVNNYSSGALYNPGDTSSHSYVVRAEKGNCYNNSTAQDFADSNGVPSLPVINSINDLDITQLTGIQINYTSGVPATRHDLYKDGSLVVSGYSSGATYQPGDNLEHNYLIRAVNENCTTYSDSVQVAGTDGAPPPEVAVGTNFTWNATQSAQTFNWTLEPSATGYNIYRGTKSNLANLCNTDSDFCTRSDQSGTSLDISSDSPQTIDPTNKVLFYLITGYNAGGEGPAGTATCGDRHVNTTGTCPP